jgi:uncharacterized protein (TIGR03435 family)
MSLAGLAAIHAQPQDAAPAFEVASIKPTQMTDGHVHINRDPGMLRMENVTLQDCIREAYRVTDYQISGEKWLGPDRYDLVAKMPAGATEDQRPAMLRTLLAERFKLAVHRGTREMPVYLLVVAKNGPKIQAVDSHADNISSHPGYMSAEGIIMPRLAAFLSSARAQLEHTVIDHTGLSGAFTFKLEWTPDDKWSVDTAGPSIVAALQEQLGLKLETGKTPVEILIVDHAGKPSEN